MPKETRMQLVRAICAAVASVAFSPAAVAQDDMVEAGKKIFLETAGDIGCAACHLEDASGDVGPNIRGVDAGFIRDAVHGGVEDMAFIELTDAEIEQVAAYLATLD